MTELDLIRRGFAYDRWANERLIDALAAAGPNDQAARRLMGHVLVAQQAWFLRVTSDPAPKLELWPDLPCPALRSFMLDMHEQWINFLAQQGDAAVERMFSYVTSTGLQFTSSLGEILAHVLNHGTHHRAQIASMIRSGGSIPPATDFIVFTRGT